MGVIQQYFGHLDYILYQGNGLFYFSEIMDSLSLYASIILLVIRRDVPPKHQLRDLFLFFVGLDFFYYLYIFIIELIAFISGNTTPPDPALDTNIPFAQTIHEIGDFIKWTVIGLAAAIWAFFATKLRNKEKRVLYILMLSPLFAVMAILFVGNTLGTVLYFIAEHQLASNPEGAYNSYICQLAGALTSLIALALCLFMFLKKPALKKNNAQ